MSLWSPIDCVVTCWEVLVCLCFFCISSCSHVFFITGTFTVDDDEITNTLHKVYHEHGYTLCPHTAVGAAYHYRCVCVCVFVHVCMHFCQLEPTYLDSLITQNLNFPSFTVSLFICVQYHYHMSILEHYGKTHCNYPWFITRNVGGEHLPRAYIATASPAKFPEALEKAGVPPVTELVTRLKSLPTRSMEMKKGEDWYAMLRTKIESITARR